MIASTLALSNKPFSLYFKFACFGICLTIIGFLPTYLGPMVSTGKEFEMVFHLHGLFCALWLLLLLSQTFMIHSGNRAVHKKLGYASVVVAIGIFVTLQMVGLRSHELIALETGDADISFVITPFLDSLTFAALYIGAIYYRKKPDIHKRLMVLATILLLWVAWVRLRHYLPPFPYAFELFGFIFGIIMPILVFWWIEYIKTKKVHPVMLYGGIFVICEQWMQVLFVSDQSPFWKSLSTDVYNLLKSIYF
ncbi:MAG: hypothetical protein OEY96_12000 [Gammaproteobacteria bacterium]|nr:hypothetical protein [Gammaproteobacteria bacterium]